MVRAQASERELIEQFLTALQSLPDVQAELESAGALGHDAQLALDVAGKLIHAFVELRKTVYPRDIRQFEWRVRDTAGQHPAGESGGEPRAIQVAKSISPGAKELLRAEPVGYYDSRGCLYLSARGGMPFDRPSMRHPSIPAHPGLKFFRPGTRRDVTGSIVRSDGVAHQVSSPNHSMQGRLRRGCRGKV